MSLDELAADKMLALFGREVPNAAGVPVPVTETSRALKKTLAATVNRE